MGLTTSKPQPARWQTLEETPEICARRGSNIYPFPGCRWGKEPPCNDRRFVVPAGRVSWAASMLSLANLSAPLDGLEIGACGAPIRMPSGVRMVYADIGSNTGAALCYYSGENSQAIQLIDDAEVLRKVASSSKDVVIASHVLEHAHRTLKTLHTWLRVLKPGGVAMFILPDMCDRERDGDHFRLATEASHFVDEYREHNASNRNHHEHLREAALNAFGFDKRLKGERIPRVLPSYLRADDLSRYVRQYEAVPHAAHLHTWTLPTLRRMLHAAQAEFRPLAFALLDVAAYYGPTNDVSGTRSLGVHDVL